MPAIRGLTFTPGQTGDRARPQDVQRAIQILSLRLPKRSQGAPVAPGLLAGQGGGQPSPLLAAVLRSVAAGQAPQSRPGTGSPPTVDALMSFLQNNTGDRGREGRGFGVSQGIRESLLPSQQPTSAPSAIRTSSPAPVVSRSRVSRPAAQTQIAQGAQTQIAQGAQSLRRQAPSPKFVFGFGPQLGRDRFGAPFARR